MPPSSRLTFSDPLEAGQYLVRLATLDKREIQTKKIPTASRWAKKLVFDEAYNAHLDRMIEDVESGRVQAAGPFTGEEAVAYLDSLMTR